MKTDDQDFLLNRAVRHLEHGEPVAGDQGQAQGQLYAPGMPTVEEIKATIRAHQKAERRAKLVGFAINISIGAFMNFVTVTAALYVFWNFLR